MSEFKPCPKCGSDDVVITSEIYYFNMDPEHFGDEEIYKAVHCTICGFTGKFSSDIHGDKDKWNEYNRETDRKIRKTGKIAIIR